MSTTEQAEHTERTGQATGAGPPWPGGDGADAAADAGDAFALAQQAACDQLAVLIGRAAACRATGL